MPRLTAIILGLWATFPAMAKAQFAVCNQTFDVINVAIGIYDRDAFVTEGWWTIGPNQCANVIDDALRARYVYAFAQDVFGRMLLTGTTPMCVGPDRFRIRGDDDCLLRGYIAAPFREIDTQRTERWTLFVTPSPN